MGFIGDRDWRLLDYRARWLDGDRIVEATVAWDPDGESLFVATVDGTAYPIDEEGDLLELAPAGATVTFERGGVSVSLCEVAGRVEAWACTPDGSTGARVVDSAWASAVERALHALGGAGRVPRICFLCTHSDYEPSTGFGGGHLACFVASAAAYHEVATATTNWERKYGSWARALDYRWVDEMDTCSQWARRPPRHGYRG